jgi:hypothetical protein
MSLLLALTGGGGGSAYALSLDAGAYVYTGQAATFSVGRSLPLAAGGYVYTGQPLSATFGRGLALEAGSYNYVGQDATLTYQSGTSPIPMGGSGHPVDWQGKRRKNTFADEPNRHLEHILDRVVSELYGEVLDAAPQPAKLEAKATVKPFTIAKTKGVPSVSNVDWKALEQDLEAVRAIRDLWLREVALRNEEEEVALLWLTMH